MKYTLLEMTQRILSSIDGDEVNSISDTVEAEQVAFIIQSVYYDIASSMELPEHETLFSLDASADYDKPVLMTLPTGVTDLQWLKYDKRDAELDQSEWRDIPFCTLEDFLTRMQGLEEEPTHSKITPSTTYIGDFDIDPAKAFDEDDGTVLAADTAQATLTTSEEGTWIGYTLTTPQAVSKVTVYGTTDFGYSADTGPVLANRQIRLSLYGKNGTAPTGQSDGQLLAQTGFFVQSADESTPRTLTSTDDTTKWDHLWVRIDRDSSGVTGFMYVGEVQFYTTNVAGENDSMQVDTGNGTFEFLYRTDRHPDYYTIIGEDTFIFNSFKKSVEDTLQESKVMCFGTMFPTFTLSDTFTPDLDQTQFSYLLNKAKARAFTELKQVENREAVGEAREQRVWSQRRKRNVPFGGEVERIARYGRK
jgi:hypothetical protein